MPHPLLMTLLIGLGVIVYLHCLLWLIGKLSGWQKLARLYPLTKQPVGKSWHWQSAKLGWWAQYNGALTFVVDDAGLACSICSLFRSGHPPIFIPWSEMTLAEPPSEKQPIPLKVNVGQPVVVTLTLPKAVMTEVLPRLTQ
jgi:hypothetical protein